MTQPTPAASVPQTLEDALAALASQQAQMEHMQQAHAAWMRAVSHDLRAPLRHVVSFAPLLRESVQTLVQAAPHLAEAGEDATEFAATMESAARKMGDMLEGMAQVSRAARALLVLGAVDMVALTHQLVLPMQAHHPSVRWVLPQGVAMVQADAHGLAAAMQVALDNAVKFAARAKAPEVIITVTPSEHGGWSWQVQDNGAGFDAARAQQLGQLFQRMHRDTEYEGAGCGLALLDIWVQRHGAQWHIAAQPGVGCTLRLDWPSA